MKIRSVASNNRKKEFEVTTYNGSTFSFPYADADPQPSSDNPIRHRQVFVDKELGNEAITYTLASGEEGSVHIEQILEYNEDPKYFAELLTYKLSLEAKRTIENSVLSRRQIARKLNTSVPQLYRLLDLGNTRKSMNQLVTLLHILKLDVNFIVKKRAA